MSESIVVNDDDEDDDEDDDDADEVTVVDLFNNTVYPNTVWWLLSCSPSARIGVTNTFRTVPVKSRLNPTKEQLVLMVVIKKGTSVSY